MFANGKRSKAEVCGRFFALKCGSGGTLTTFAAAAEPEVQALLGMPSHMAVAAMVPIGLPVEQLTRLRRDAIEAIATIDHASGVPLRPSQAE
jgi:hypothetical protein